MRVSELCLGTAAFGRELTMHGREPLAEPIVDEETAHELLTVATERGINFIDTADTYGRPELGRTERIIGEWLADRDRDRFVIASKVGLTVTDGRPDQTGLSRRHVRASIEASLERLGTDYLDLYLIHRWDDATPIEETLRTLDDLVSEGTVHHVGASNLAAWQLAQAIERSDARGLARFDVLQAPYSAAERDRSAALLDVSADQDVALCPYSPLMGGFLAGKYERDREAPAGSRASRNEEYGRFTERQWRVLDAVRAVADEVDAPVAAVALRWLVERDGVPAVPIVGPRTRSHLEENLQAATLSLTREQRTRITRAYEE